MASQIALTIYSTWKQASTASTLECNRLCIPPRAASLLIRCCVTQKICCACLPTLELRLLILTFTIPIQHLFLATCCQNGRRLCHLKSCRYIRVVNPIAFILFKHGWKGTLGWLALQSFCFTRIIGNILVLKYGDKSTAATIVNTFGLSPLLVGAIGVIHGAWVSSQTPRLCTQSHNSAGDQHDTLSSIVAESGVSSSTSTQ